MWGGLNEISECIWQASFSDLVIHICLCCFKNRIQKQAYITDEQIKAPKINKESIGERQQTRVKIMVGWWTNEKKNIQTDGKTEN